MSEKFILPLRSKIAAGLVTALLVLVVSAMSFWMLFRAAESFEEVAHTSGVLLEQQKLLASLIDLETAARGYAITGNESFLTPFEAARTAVPLSISRLRRMMTDHPEQQARLNTLESVAGDQLRFNLQIIRQRKTQGFQMARDMIETEQARLVMDHARSLTMSMEEEENRILTIRAANQKRDERLAFLVIGIGGAIAFLLSIFINRGIRSDVIERDRQREMIETQTRQLTKQAETLKTQQEEQARLTKQMAALLESTDAGFYGMDPAGACTFINRAGARMLGYKRKELIGRNMHELVHYAHRDGTPYPKEKCPIVIATQQGAGAAAEDEVFWRRDGTPVSVEYSTSPVIQDGKHLGAVVAFADITQRLAAQHAIRESEERKAAVLRSTLDSIVTMSADGTVLEFNPAAERTFGFTREEVVGNKLVDFIIPHRFREAHMSGLARYTATGEAHVLGQRLELPALRKDGTEFQSELTITRSDAGEKQTFTGVLRDITQRKNQEAEREQLIKALARSNQELDQFAYVASHDLKAPLRGIANLSQWIEEDLGDTLKQENKDQMELLRGRVHRMEALIDGILQYSRAGRVKSRPEQVDTGTLVHEVVELIAPPPSIRIEIAPDMPTVSSEKVPLQQVFMNLLGNAIKHAGASDPKVHVGWEEGGPFYEFSVTDNGPGIAPQYHERIFGIFQTLEARDKVEGTGIGLSVVQKIVEAKGGRVWVESEVGKGARFKFLWPKAEITGA
ncbi:MAG TPA: PAS domain S-box protein [Gemmatimonadaceae bacterium]|nr:PAS domain S-box protein [Gemmatimonadaceae bacterium]